MTLCEGCAFFKKGECTVLAERPKNCSFRKSKGDVLAGRIRAWKRLLCLRSEHQTKISDKYYSGVSIQNILRRWL
jgi:Fe-S-cluster containining protein